MKSYFRIFILFLLIMTVACSGEDRGGRNTNSDSDADTVDLDIGGSNDHDTSPDDAIISKPDATIIEQDCDAIAMTQGPSQPCCIAYGIDACGPNLFCAAFDGRSQPACYVDRSRLDGESCGADKHCLGASCNATT